MQFETPTRRRWTLNYYITQCTGNSISWRQDAVEKASTQQRGPSSPRLSNCSWGSDELEIRRVRENQYPERLGPQATGWAAQENGKETRLWPIEWGSICCSSVRSPTPSYKQPFEIKWEVYFSKNCVARLNYCDVVMILHAYVDVDVYVLCFSSSVKSENVTCLVITYIQFCVHWHGDQCLRRLVPNYAVVFWLGWVYLPVTLCHLRSRRR